MPDSTFVARERELAHLDSYLQRALAGHGQVCFVVGQAGAGKSALLREFAARALKDHADLVAASGECNAQTGIGDPYLPFREALAQLAGAAEPKPDQGAAGAENTRRLRTAIVHSARVLVDVAPDLVGLMIPGGKILGELGKAIAKNVGLLDDLERLMKSKGQAAALNAGDQARLFEQYTHFVQELSLQRPIILLLDDLQWADAASISLLFYLGRRLADHRVLMVGAYRPDDVALGRGGERHPLEAVLNEFKRYFGETEIDLDRATAEGGRAFVDALLDPASYAVGDPFRQALYNQTEGHALFTVEVLRSMQETGALVRDAQGRWVEGAKLDWSIIPARVEGVVEERIARLEDKVRDMLRVASVEGEQFTAEIVATIRQSDPRALVRTLSDDVERQHHLVHADGMHRVGDRRLSLYRFLHSMIQRYLYTTLGEAERAYLHEDVGNLLESWYADAGEEIAVQLAHHFEQAGDTFRAVRYYLMAGNRARRMSAYQEAYAHLCRGLALVQTFGEDSLERVAFELGLQAALGSTLIATRGYASDEVRQAFARARELCRVMRDPPQVIPVLYGMCLYYLVGGQVGPAQEEGERLLKLAEEAGDHAYVLGCHVLLAATSAYQGEPGRAQRHCEQALELYQPDADAAVAVQHGQDPAVVALSYLAWVLWLQGDLAQAAARQSQALAMAERVAHPFSQALALSFAAITDHFCGDWVAAQARAEQALALARREHFPFWEGMATQMLGTALARRGQHRAGIALIQQGLAAWEQAGTRVGVPMFMLSLADAYFRAGQHGRALDLVARSLEAAEETKQTWWFAEQHRLRGEVLRSRGDGQQAMACFREALDIARRQGARMLELRAAISLVKAGGLPEEREQARRDLARIYAWFPADLSAPELAEACQLLA